LSVRRKKELEALFGEVKQLIEKWETEQITRSVPCINSITDLINRVCTIKRANQDPDGFGVLEKYKDDELGNIHDLVLGLHFEKLEVAMKNLRKSM